MSFIRLTMSFNRVTISFKPLSISFKRDTMSFKRGIKSFKNDLVCRLNNIAFYFFVSQCRIKGLRITLYIQLKIIVNEFFVPKNLSLPKLHLEVLKIMMCRD